MNENPLKKHFPGKTDQKGCQVVEKAQKTAGEKLGFQETVNPGGP